MRANYHTHTRWCKHGTGEIEEYIEEAIKHGLEEIAITEHVPLEDNREVNRLQWEEFEDFNQTLDKSIQIYENQIRIIKGLECEYYPEEMETYERFRKEYGYKLLILGQHRSGKNREVDSFAEKGSKEILSYVTDLCDGIRTGMFDFVAHPDLVVQGYSVEWDEELEAALRKIYRICEQYDTPIEINANGIRNYKSYPSRHALILSKDYKLRYLISSDAHHPEDLVDWAVRETEKMADDAGIIVMDKLNI